MDEEMMFEMSAGSLEGLPSVGEMFDLTGKVAVVSGTIGLALSVIYRLASCGAKVVFGARREVIGQMAEERLREMGLDVRFHKLDVSSVESCREIVAFAEQTYGTVDIVVPVAAAFSPARLWISRSQNTTASLMSTRRVSISLCRLPREA